MRLSQSTRHVLFLSLLIFINACGNKESGKSSNSEQNSVEERQEDQGIYRVVLKHLNPVFAGETTGTLQIKIQGDDVIVDGTMANAQAGVKHLQSIMSGTMCPDEKADSNEDSVVDIQETLHFTRQVFVPLDSDLSEQLAGMDFGPIANNSGTFVYRRSTTLSQLLSDLRLPDPDVLDYVTKLLPESDLNLAGKVILVMGLSERTALPDSVKRLDPLSVHQSFPIACGKIVRVKDEGQVQ